MDDRTKGLTQDEEIGADRNAVGDESDSRTHGIRAEIEQTRDDMSETIDAIQEKLRPGNLVSEATDRVRNAARGKVKQMAYAASDSAGRVADAGRQNWIPAALIGIGTAWLLMRRSDSRQYAYDDESVYGSAEYGSGSGAYGAVGTRGYDQSRAGISDAYREGRDSVSGMAGRVGDRASEIAGRAGQFAQQTRSTVTRSTRRAQNQLQRMIQENPLMVGAAAAVIGAAVGLALPETDRENEWMGEARDSVVDKAQDAARDAVDKAKDVASKTVGDAITGRND